MPTLPITQYYQDDHDRLDNLFRNFQQLKRTDFASAKPFFRDFLFGLKRHIIWEEEILFPVFEGAMGGPTGPTNVMRMEHRLIEQALESIHAKVKQQNPDSDEDEQLLLNTLAAHNQKEDMILYPAIDRRLGSEERDAVYAEMNRLPAERYAVCCGGK